MPKIQVAEIERAQQAWGAGVVAIGEVYSQGGDFSARARTHIEGLYAYHLGDVLFKPTLAAERPFRRTLKGALSYFVAGDPDFPEDHGFALRPWVAVRFENEGMVSQDMWAVAMGNYFFRDASGAEEKVEFSFAYIRAPDGRLLIHLHHSSLPYDPPAERV
jgi:hypothetical protein